MECYAIGVRRAAVCALALVFIFPNTAEASRCGRWLWAMAQRVWVGPPPPVLADDERATFVAWAHRWSTKTLGTYYRPTYDEGFAAWNELPTALQKKVAPPGLARHHLVRFWKSWGVDTENFPLMQFAMSKPGAPSADDGKHVAALRKRIQLLARWATLLHSEGNPLYAVRIHAQHVEMPEGAKFPILRRETAMDGRPYLVIGVPQHRVLHTVEHLDRKLEDYYAEQDLTDAVIQGIFYPDGTFVVSDTEMAFWYAVKNAQPNEHPSRPEPFDPDYETEDGVWAGSMARDPRALLPVALSIAADGMGYTETYVSIWKFRKYGPFDGEIEEHWEALGEEGQALWQEAQLNQAAMAIGVAPQSPVAKNFFRRHWNLIPDKWAFKRLFEFRVWRGN